MLSDSQAALHKEPDAEQAYGDDFQFIPAAVLLPRIGKRAFAMAKMNGHIKCMIMPGTWGPF